MTISAYRLELAMKLAEYVFGRSFSHVPVNLDTPASPLEGHLALFPDLPGLA